jgi:hypothetical protein
VKTPGDDVTRVRLAFNMAHGRVPSEAETSDALAFIAAYRQKLASLAKLPDDAWASLAHVLLTSNAFLYVD